MDGEKDLDCEQQLSKNMAINVYKNGEWGTYRHLLINRNITRECEHCYVLSTVRGDLSSLKWLEGPLAHDSKPLPEKTLVYVHYCSINFRDVMTASGRINVDVVTTDRLEQEAVQGFEYAGIDECGNRVMAMATCLSLATLVSADKYLLINVPDDMTLEEAATIPVVYGTVIYALIVRGKLKRGESVLIHSGTGGIGQAAIRMALSYGCTVFATVGTKEKKEFLLKMFPQLKESHIGNSHDTSFEQMVYRETNGKGIDVVLNSLAEEKLLTSVRCLAKGGRFLEIGKFDLGNNNDLNLLLLQKAASFHGIMLDKIFTETPSVKNAIINILLENLKNKTIRPLNRTIFKYNEIEQAFRYMATGKHTGKVLVEVRPENQKSPTQQLFPCYARFVCNPDKTYVIVGGLGGFGLELADWLVLRGARKLVLTSRKGIVTGYQKYRTRIWLSYGVITHVCQADITTENGCEQLLKEAQEIGPVDSIFNLAVVLADAVFENQSVESFITSFKPKAFATKHLDVFSRKLCPTLRNFVVFSSVSCGRGNAGQTNYGMANSVMERICENRRKDGYPAVAIQWGAIGEVGLVAEMQEEHIEIEIGGTLQQKISSCMNALDVLLKQNEAVIVSSMVVAEKKKGSDSTNNIVDDVLYVLGIADAKAVSLHATFAELGMDSMVAVEIKQTLEREYEVFLSPKEIRTLTLAKLLEIQEEQNSEDNGAKIKSTQFGMEMLIGKLTKQSKSSDRLVKLKSSISAGEKNSKKILLFPGIEGRSFALEPLASKIQAEVYCLQYPQKMSVTTVQELVETLMPVVKQTISKSEPFNFVAHSFGCLIALEVVHNLEKQGYNGSVFLIESTPELLIALATALKVQYKEDWETSLMCNLLSFYMPQDEIAKHQDSLRNCSSWDDRVNLGIDICKHQSILDAEYQRESANGIYEKLRLTLSYESSFEKLNSPLCLVKASETEFLGLDETYGLSNITEHPVKVEVLGGGHHSVLDNEMLVSLLNSWVMKDG